ncbi:ribonuclease H-like domain-containing protein [Leptospira sp. FAT2]|uniref:ribonuclease H-like domain-containing protein n=1 Tax=Leptospira sanjuanensis TaxID=2879643 RepID=UPI001EE7BB37|nr:ribonuclease H-like domain-containing protein [Leptospira sanjuanensis]MCG6166879.1 ribonuclease H-like domain-containing protein [Leptospira sanjuanensis]MCG6192264.1 ribonuclease H-like domain-containing protein [Leptospira sanjuanensis]
MLEHTFCHLPGIDSVEEKNLWQKGIYDWKDLKVYLKDESIPIRNLILDALEFSKKELERENFFYFFHVLSAKHHWRLFPKIRKKLLYLDIETTGLGSDDRTTVIGTYDGEEYRSYVRGFNLDFFLDNLRQDQIFVSYNGIGFDVPFLEKEFNVRFRNNHIDIMFFLRSLGIKGGLKGCEKALGIHRPEEAAINGIEAVRLWKQYVDYDDTDALKILEGYNREDTVNLEILFVKGYNLKIKETPFYGEIIQEPERRG